MVLTSLSLTNFRIFNRLEAEVPRRILLLVGENAQGKTSFLEAIYYFATLNSFNATNDRQLINFAALKDELPVARMVACFQRADGNHRLEIRLILDAGMNGSGRLRKEILINGIKRNQQEIIGKFISVVFLPQMMRILEGGPEERRRFLDNVLSQAYSGYANAINEYATAITQRNALLKQLAERGGDLEQLNYWDEMITSRGALIIQSRIRAIQEMEKFAALEHLKLTNEKESLSLIYQPSYDPYPNSQSQMKLNIASPVKRSEIPLEEIKSGFARKLKEIRKEEIARGVTSIGPHRDELRGVSNGIDLGIYGSRGQIRSAIISLKLAEVKWLKEKTNEWPVLLLDETLAELDHQHRMDLMEKLLDCEQVILTTTDKHLFSDTFTKNCAIWNVKAGSIAPELN
jgi:DNA replication and repair protein RecF